MGVQRSYTRNLDGKEVWAMALDRLPFYNGTYQIP